MRKILMAIMVLCMSLGFVGCNDKSADVSKLSSRDIMEYMNPDYRDAYTEEQREIIAETISTILEIVQRVNNEKKYTDIDVALSKYARDMTLKCLDMSNDIKIGADDWKVKSSAEYALNGIGIIGSAWMDMEPLKGNKEKVQDSLNGIANLTKDKYIDIVTPYLKIDMEKYEDYRVFIINNTVK